MVSDLGFYGRQGEHMVAVENTDETQQHGRLHPVQLLSVAAAWVSRRVGTNPMPTAPVRCASRAKFWPISE